MRKDCAFCKIVAGRIPSEKIWEDKNHIAILDIFPNTKGFTIVLAKKHLPSYVFENSDRVVSELVLATKKVAKLLDKSFKDVGRSGVFFEGFGVDHLHSKLFPMHGTSKMQDWEMIEETKPGPFYKKYPGYLSSKSSRKADFKNLAKTAAGIRTYK